MSSATSIDIDLFKSLELHYTGGDKLFMYVLRRLYDIVSLPLAIPPDYIISAFVSPI